MPRSARSHCCSIRLRWSGGAGIRMCCIEFAGGSSSIEAAARGSKNESASFMIAGGASSNMWSACDHSAGCILWAERVWIDLRGIDTVLLADRSGWRSIHLLWLPLVCSSWEDFLFSWFVPIQAGRSLHLNLLLNLHFRLYHLPFEYLQDIRGSQVNVTLR